MQKWQSCQLLFCRLDFSEASYAYSSYWLCYRRNTDYMLKTSAAVDDVILKHIYLIKYLMVYLVVQFDRELDYQVNIGTRSTAGSQSDCIFRGRKFDSAPVSYFRGD